MKALTFVDRVKVYVMAGRGGNGCCSFRREKFVPKGGPDGGDGGKGGDVIFQADKNVDSLIALHYQPHIRAENGTHGKGKKQHGRNGRDLVVKVPPGTVVTDLEEGTYFGELLEQDQQMTIAAGGRGGLGNCHFTSPTHQAPRECTPGESGQEFTLRLELKIVADVGLVGYPNAGKSTLLSRISHAHPKIAAYPFTTLNPVIGTLQFNDFHNLRIADMPGLIEGAHDGVGLGHDFLRHIERTREILFVIDMAGVDGRDPSKDYFQLREELRLYKPDLDRRPYLIVANKMDLPQAAEHLEAFKLATGEHPVCVSAETRQDLDKLLDALHKRFFEGIEDPGL